MKLTRIQKIGLAFFIGSLLPAYLIANWRYEVKLADLNAMFQKEQSLHLSTDRLLENCENNPAHKAQPYDATHRICSQGSDIHARTQHVMTILSEDKAKNDIARYQIFGLVLLIFNLCALAIYKASIYLRREIN